ncbi:MAG: hypothetical protein H7287_13310, partial [Thermoleophilia bacterium]|nr:hypothetical protein [Thermoleophilia bacterium]
DRFRRTRDAGEAVQPVETAAASMHPLIGVALGSVERTYGLMKSEQIVYVVDVLSASGDLAVADRLAFVASIERHAPLVVVLLEGWYLVCATDVTLDAAALAHLRELPDGSCAPRLMSIASDRGITPALGPLACA